jgi:hypothetical protein
MNKEILEGNKLIAEFMGGEYTEYPNNVFAGEHGYRFPLNIDGTDWWNKNALKFDTSWDWLMPVVEKIEGLGYQVAMSPHQCQIFDSKNEFIIDADFKNTRLENTYDAVVALIEMLNKTPNAEVCDATEAASSNVDGNKK